MFSRKKTVTPPSLPRVRILIMGAAGVGKTTILQKICSETDTPIVRDPKGKLIRRLDSLIPTTARGLHDVNLEITYPSRPGFVFHDSRGLECGSANELNEIREFLVRMAKEEKTAVHVIWYCVLASSCRPLVSAERQFFERDRGEVPVIVIFTKLDGLVAKAYNELKAEGLAGGAAYQGAAARADELLQAHFVKPIKEMAHPPMGYVIFKGLHKPEGQCVELTRQTVKALEHNQNLQMMFLLASRYDLEARLNALVCKVQMNETDENIIRKSMAYFPHVWYMRGLSSSLGSSWSSSESEWGWSGMSPFIPSFAPVIPPKLPLADQFRKLALFAGTCIVADICFWTTQRTESSTMKQEELLSGLQHAVNQYQQEKRDVIIQAICQMPSGLSNEGMLAAVKDLVLQHGQFSSVAKARAL